MPDFNCDSHAHNTQLTLCLCFVSLLSLSTVFSGSYAINLVVLASGSHIQLRRGASGSEPRFKTKKQKNQAVFFLNSCATCN